jgi:uncharacterized protein (DUF433 family)
MKYDRIAAEPERMDGVPCIRGLRIPVATVVAFFGEGLSEQEVLEAYPDLEREDLRQALAFAAEALEERMLPLVEAE